MICKRVYIIGNTGTHCPIHFTLSDTKDAWLLSVEPDLLAAVLVALAIAGCFSGWSLVLVHLLVLRMTAGSKRRFCVSLISVTLLVGFRFFGFTGLSKFLFMNFRFAFCSPPVTVKVLFVPVNSIGVGSIASLCSNYVKSTRSKIVQLLGFCLGHCN